MGRKIPAKKHRGVKDPVVQQAKRLASLKGKINAPPKDPDDQPVPKSLTRLFAFQNSDNRKSVTKKKNHTSRQHLQDKDGTQVNPVSRLRRLPGESGRGFSLRINTAVKALHNPAEQLHYPLDIEAEDEKGMRMSELRERRARKRRRAAPPPPGPALTRPQKLALKKHARKMKASEASSERREVVYERVSFGDVSHAPPALHFKLGGDARAPRPGTRSLLLERLLRPGQAAGQAGQERRELARHDAVAAYRALKATYQRNK